MTEVFLIEFEAFHRPTRTVRLFRRAGVPGYRTWRGDDPSDTVYDRDVVQAANIGISITASGENSGEARLSVGDTILSNRIDPVTGLRPYADLADYQFAGWPLTIFVGDHLARRSSFAVLASLTQEVPEERDEEIVLRHRNPAADFDRSALAGTYGGTGGLDGTPDMKGRRREACLGRVWNVEPTYLGVVDGLHTWSLNGGRRIKGVLEARDRMAPLAEVSSAPGATQWRQDRAAGIIQVGGNPEEEPPLLTVDAEGDMSDGVFRDRVADLVAWLATGYSGLLPVGRVDWDAVTLFRAAAPWPVGVYLPAGDGTTLRGLNDRLVRSVPPATWLVNEFGMLWMGVLEPPSGAPVARLVRDVDHLGLTVRATSDRGLPAKSVTVRGQRNNRVMNRDEIAGTVTDDRRAWAGAEWREEVSDPDPDLEEECPIAREVTIDTDLATREGCKAVAQRLQARLRTPPRQWDVPLKSVRADLKLLEVVEVQDQKRPGFEGGKIVRIVGRRASDGTGDYVLEVTE